MASPPSTGATLHLRFRAIWEARQAAISGRSTFCDDQTRGAVSELLWRAGRLSTRCWQHAATVYARSCQAKITDNMPLSPQTARLDPISDAQAENRTRHAAVEQIKTVSKIR